MKNRDCIISTTRRKRFEAQGYIGFTDAELNDFKFGIRFAYYLCGSLVVLGLLLTNLEILTVAMIIAFFGTLPPYHPFDYLYNYLIRYLTNKPKMPPRANQGRFAWNSNCMVGRNHLPFLYWTSCFGIHRGRNPGIDSYTGKYDGHLYPFHDLQFSISRTYP